MNIEEERKAFVELVYSKAGSLDFADGKFIVRQQSAWQAQAASHANHLFAAWLAAKAHAEEMAKPDVSIEQTVSGQYGLFHTEAIKVFDNPEDAREWAIINAYQVTR